MISWNISLHLSDGTVSFLTPWIGSESSSAGSLTRFRPVDGAEEVLSVEASHTHSLPARQPLSQALYPTEQWQEADLRSALFMEGNPALPVNCKPRPHLCVCSTHRWHHTLVCVSCLCRGTIVLTSSEQKGLNTSDPISQRDPAQVLRPEWGS